MRQKISTKLSTVVNFDPPRPVSRTGHVSLMIIFVSNRNKPITPEHVIHFFSLYHNHKPTEISRLPIQKKAVKRFKPQVVNSLSLDSVMRGQSWARLEDARQKEDIPVGELIETLPAESEQRKIYFQRGLCQSTIVVPVDPHRVMEALNEIEKNARWAMFAPLVSHIGIDPHAHNCCSAVWKALEKGGINHHATRLPIEISPAMKLLSWTGYFVFLCASSVDLKQCADLFSLGLVGTPALYPMLFFVMRLILSLKNAYDYASDLRTMAKDPNNVGVSTLFLAYSACFFINALGSVVTTNACFDLFKFPTSVNRALKNTPGTQTVSLTFDVEKFVKPK